MFAWWGKRSKIFIQSCCQEKQIIVKFTQGPFVMTNFTPVEQQFFSASHPLIASWCFLPCTETGRTQAASKEAFAFEVQPSKFYKGIRGETTREFYKNGNRVKRSVLIKNNSNFLFIDLSADQVSLVSVYQCFIRLDITTPGAQIHTFKVQTVAPRSLNAPVSSLNIVCFSCLQQVSTNVATSFFFFNRERTKLCCINFGCGPFAIGGKKGILHLKYLTASQIQGL